MSKLGIICAMEEELAPFVSLRDERLLLIKSGVGKVNAAIATMEVIQQGAEQVLVVGVAGAVNPSLKTGDVVIAKGAIQYDVDATALGFKLSEIPFAARSRWNADPRLVEELLEATHGLGITTYGGCVLTGDRFVANAEEVARLRRDFNGACLDMETAAVAQACDAKRIPWAALRVMSDGADEQGPKDFAQFLVSSAQKAARIVERLSSLRSA